MRHYLVAALLSLALVTGAQAAVGGVYKWTDEHGVIHYDDQNLLAKRLTRGDIAKREVAAEASATVPAAFVTDVKRRCEALRDRTRAYQQANQLYGRDPSGNVYKMSVAQSSLVVAELERDKTRYCRPEAARLIYNEPRKSPAAKAARAR